MTETNRFPKGFLWGVATSAYQIEGSPLADGAGPNIWHRFSRLPGRVTDGATGDVACDHYNRYADDLALMDTLGISAYRFSVAWGRVLPEGRGRVNAKGLAFYDRLVDKLLELEIVPFGTLYHWDLPLGLEDKGGWLNEDVAHWFGDFASLTIRTLGDRVPFWVTINEPAVIMEKGYVLGTYAPGHRNPAEAPVVARNLLRAHGMGVQACRAASSAQVGIAVNLQPKHPASDDRADVAAARRADAFRNLQFLDAILLGHSPPELPAMFGETWLPLSTADMVLTHQPIDFVGLNYYTRVVVADDAETLPTRAEPIVVEDARRTLMGWEVYPDGLYEVLMHVTNRYGKIAMYVTENGSAFPDPAPEDGQAVRDPDRVSFLREHLRRALKARLDGADLRGYFVWSLLDNFEWNSGYSRPFGLVRVDLASQRRTMKESGNFYAEVIRTAGTNLQEP
ncbi:MAG TPA: GH1 family beta-glucosidase [Gemmatimonadaceae bacterium]